MREGEKDRGEKDMMGRLGRREGVRRRRGGDEREKKRDRG